MATSEYFDARTLNRSAGNAERTCPVKLCKAAPHRRLIGDRFRLSCPVHGIDIHSKTFVYKDPLRNIRFEQEYFKRAILHNKVKAETHRFGYENSEDALTWNVFSVLAKRRKLNALSRYFTKIDTSDEPELYLWGLKIDLDNQVAPKQFAGLIAARKVFEKDIRGVRTEPDIMLYIPKKFLILIEAKFTSGNTVVKPGESNDAREKPKSAKGILQRYSIDQLPTGSLLSPSSDTPLYSQLYRNLVFAIYMADKLNVQWGLVNLTSKLPAEVMSVGLTDFTNAFLPRETRQRFVRYTWEQLFHDHVAGKGDLQELAPYLQFKSANCGKAFDI